MTNKQDLLAADSKEAPKWVWKEYRIEDYVSLVIFWALILLVLIQVISRYLFHSSFIWSEELARYHFIALTFIGSALVARKGFIKIEFFTAFLPSKVNFILSIIVNVVELMFLAIATCLAWSMFLFMCTKKMVSINVSMGFLYAGILGGFLGLTFRSIQFFARRLRRPIDSIGK
jgi:TRAP-type C4-dicarboxylate transport system permease small subunit